MKKILNNPADYVDEMLEGLTAAHPEFYRLVGETKRAVARATPANQFGSFTDCCQSLNSPHVSSPGTLGFGNLRRPTSVSSRLRRASY